METYKLLCEKRNLAVKAKTSKKEGYVPAVVYGHHLDPIHILISHAEITRFLHANSLGSKVILSIEGSEHLAIFKDSQRDPLSHKIIHIDFQALTSGEKIKVTVPIVFQNKDSVGNDKVLQEQLSEIEILALPKFLIDHVEVDVAKYDLGDSALVSDLDIYNDKNIEILSPHDSQVLIISHAAKFTEETVNDEEQIQEPVLVTETTEE